MKPLADGARAVILFNRGTEAGEIYTSWEDIGLAPGTKASLRDLWTGKDLGVLEKRFEAKVGPHDVLMMRVTPIERGQ
jgi:alpha-galactosidase